MISGEHRVDLAVPLDDTLGDVLRGIGYTIDPSRHVVLERGGVEAKLTTRGSDLVDGAMYSIIDLRSKLTAGGASGRSGTARDRGALWFLLAMVAVIAVGVRLLGAGASVEDDPLQRVIGGVVLVIAAVVSALVWSRQHPADLSIDALSMLSPVALAFAAGFALIPLSLEQGEHLAVLSGLLASAVLSALLTATIGGNRLRSSAGTGTIILLVLGAIWGITLLTGMGIAAAAAISAGAVPLALRAIPASLVNIEDGYSINYEMFMSNRWTVRGAIPESPSRISSAAVGEVVEDSSARLLAGTVLLSAIGPIMIPIALTGDFRANPLVLGGSIGLLSTLVIALVLISRHTASPPLRWVPRAAAILVVVEAAVGAIVLFGPLALTVGALGFLVLGLFVAALLVPIGRGARSLVWSRMADVFEALVVALSLPAALLAADVLGVVRGMMAA